MIERLSAMTYGKALFFGLILAGLYFMSPMYDSGNSLLLTLNNSKAELEKLKGEVKAVNDALKEAERFQLNMSQLGEEMDRILKAIPEKLSPGELMKIASNEAKGIGCEINKIVASNEGQLNSMGTEEVFYEPVGVDVDLSGTYNQLMLFLSNLTRLDKIVTLKRIRLSNSDTNSRSTNPELKLSAVLQAYKYIGNPGAGKNPKGGFRR